ncbi:MAG: 50S ribosomal protein L32 [Candidatus Levybacteria bacterium RBG_13_35_9]|nr:MAG: 50S ribosomal protein L32 [Candidatus Levybacteria bacterium RBG_13_35_9]
MPQEPKKRHSRARQGKRRASIHLNLAKTVPCSNCTTLIMSHTVCKNCGYYKGALVINKSKKEKKQDKTESKTQIEQTQ